MVFTVQKIQKIPILRGKPSLDLSLNHAETKQSVDSYPPVVSELWIIPSKFGLTREVDFAVSS